MTIDDAAARLRDFGWSASEITGDGPEGIVWQVTASRGEDQIVARASSQIEAWAEAERMARLVGKPNRFVDAFQAVAFAIVVLVFLAFLVAELLGLLHFVSDPMGFVIPSPAAANLCGGQQDSALRLRCRGTEALRTADHQPIRVRGATLVVRVAQAQIVDACFRQRHIQNRVAVLFGVVPLGHELPLLVV